MKRRRTRTVKPPTLLVKCACLLLQQRNADGSWLIPEPARSQGTAKEIVGMVQFHHWRIPAALDGTSTNATPQALVPLLAGDHQYVTRTHTVPLIAKAKRIAKKNDQHKAALDAKHGRVEATSAREGAGAAENKIFEKFGSVSALDHITPRQTRKKRKLQSQGFRGSRSFSGEIRWRKDRKNNP